MVDDRLRIPAIGLDARLSSKPVSPQGQLPDPDSPDDVVLYDFAAIPKYGGKPGDGNAVIYGKPDSGLQPCKEGTVPPPCEAVFWNLVRVKSGDEVVIDWEGERYEYKVASLCTVPRTKNFDAIYLPTDAPTLTLLTFGGDFDRENLAYSDLRFVRAESEQGTLESSCPTGSTTFPTPTPGPRPTPRPKANVSITSLPESIRIGEQLHLEAVTSEGAACFIRIYAETGDAEAGTLIDVRDASGLLSVDWLVKDSVTPGSKRLEVNCGREPDSRELVVTE